MLTSTSVPRPARFVRYGFAIKCALFSVAAFAGSPPVFYGDGNGPITPVPPPVRPSCTAVEASESFSYPRNGTSLIAGKTFDPSTTTRGGGEVYVKTPVIPGAQVRKTAVSGGRFQYCVRPFLVNTGDGPSPAGITVYLTRNTATLPNEVGIDMALVTGRYATTPIAAKMAHSIPASATKLLGNESAPETWCATLTESAAKGLSLFVNVPRQSLRTEGIEVSNGESSTKAGSTTANTSTQRSATLKLDRNQIDAIRVPTAIQEYSTVCRLEFDSLMASETDPQPRALDAGQRFSPTGSERQAFLPVAIPAGPRSTMGTKALSLSK